MKSINIINFIKFILDINEIDLNNNLLYQKLLFDLNSYTSYTNIKIYDNYIENIISKYFTHEDTSNIILYFKNNIINFYTFHNNIEKNLNLTDFQIIINNIYIKYSNYDINDYNYILFKKIFNEYQKLLNYYLIYSLNYIVHVSKIINNYIYIKDNDILNSIIIEFKYDISYDKLFNNLNIYNLINYSNININSILEIKLNLLKYIEIFRNNTYKRCFMSNYKSICKKRKI